MADLSSFDSALEKTLLSLSGLGVSLKLRSEEKKSCYDAIVETRFIGNSSNRLWEKPFLSVVGSSQVNLVE